MITNRVANSGLIQLDMGDFFPNEEIIEYDLAQNLWQGIALREKDFRTFLKENDWSTYHKKHVALFCSVDAIIPSWAYMLLATQLSEIASTINYGSLQEVEQTLLLQNIQNIDEQQYQDTRIVIKGCADKPISEQAWTLMTMKLKPVAKSLMYGEPCSTVPIYKKKR